MSARSSCEIHPLRQEVRLVWSDLGPESPQSRASGTNETALGVEVGRALHVDQTPCSHQEADDLVLRPAGGVVPAREVEDAEHADVRAGAPAHPLIGVAAQ